MSTVFSDSTGNKYLGDCIWANHDINFPSTNFLQTSTLYSELSSDFNSLLDATTLRKGSVITQSTANSWTGYQNFLQFSPVGDSLTTRFLFGRNDLISNTAGSGGPFVQSSIRNDSNTNAATVSTSVLNGIIPVGGTGSACHVACANNVSLSAIIGRSSASIPTANYVFWYAGKLADINTSYSYYNASTLTSTVLFFIFNSSGSLSTSVSGIHYIAGAGKSLLQSGRAVYAISCSDGQTPGSQWATDLWVYDNNATLGFPVIGRVPNMLLGIGTYTYLKPVKIQGSVFPDNGSPWYLPVGTFSGKTLLMRCYSSVT